MNQRIKNCARQLQKCNCDSLLISNPINIAYLTGFNNDGGYLLITATEELTYFTSFLYKDTAKKINDCKLVVNSLTGSLFTLIANQIKKLKLKKVGFEAKTIPFLEYRTLAELLLKSDAELLKTIDLVENLRMIKTKDEISLIKKSIQVSQKAFEYVDNIFDENMSEKDLTIEVERFLRLKGDNQLAFSTIVASGQNTVFPHHVSGNHKLNKGFFLIDLGSKYYGYCADLTRVFFDGKIPFLFKRIYDTVRKAQSESIKKIREGVTAQKIDKIARTIIEKRGWGKYFGHGLGHGIGLCVHEPPLLRPNNDTVLKEGMVITIEPAVYFKDQFGVRVEDMVLVKKQGCEILSGNINR